MYNIALARGSAVPIKRYNIIGIAGTCYYYHHRRTNGPPPTRRRITTI